MNKSLVTIVIIAVLAIGAVAYLALKPSDTPATTPTPTTGSSSSGTSTQSSTQAAATITYSESGFSPTTVTVKSGDTVEIKNTSSSDVQLASDPHPSHTDDTDLNVGLVAAGQTKTFVVTKTGSFGYHNHLNPSQKGAIIIQ